MARRVNKLQRQLAKGQAGFISQSAVTIVGCGEPKKSPEWYGTEVAIAMQNMVLAAWVQGVGSCWVGAFNAQAARQILKLPESIEPIAFTPLGYPDDHAGKKKRKSLAKLVRYESWS